MRRIIACIAVATMAGCRPTEQTGSVEALVRDSAGVRIVESTTPAWGDGEPWTLGTNPQFVLRAFDDSPNNRLLDPSSIDVDSRGRIIVGDGYQAGWHAVLVYDSLGQFQFQAGGPGEGPGEFGQLWWAAAYRGDSIAAFDMSGDKLSIFGPQGEFARLVRTPALTPEPPPAGTYGFVGGVDAVYRDGRFLAYPFGTLDIADGPGATWYKHLLLRLAADGATWDTLGRFEISQRYWSGSEQQQLVYGAVSVTAVDSGSLYFGRGDRFEIRRYDSGRRLTQIMRRAYDPVQVTEEQRARFKTWYLDRVSTSPEVNDELLRKIADDFESTPVAETLPAISAVLLDDQGFLWVEEFRWFTSMDPYPVTGPTRWSVFRPDGVWLGNVETPPGFILRRVTVNRALGFRVSDLGVKEIDVYRLRRNDK